MTATGLGRQVSLEDSFAHCRAVARSRARNFYYSFLLLPAEKRKAMCALYAFMRYCDDISDEPGAAQGRAGKLEQWKAALANALQGEYGGDLVLPAFHQTIERYRIPPRYFFELIEGVGSDLTISRYETFDDLYHYCYRVASVVGLSSMHVFGYEAAEALALAEKCGIAFQLTNILRDVREDAERGRVYLPAEDLRRFGLRAEDLLEGRWGPAWRSLVEFEWRRAHRYYEEAAPVLSLVHPESRAGLWAMISIYYGILRRIKDADFDVHTRRARLRLPQKLWIVARAFQMRLDKRSAEAAVNGFSFPEKLS
jgi:15-cis-phytoene synthase